MYALQLMPEGGSIITSSVDVQVTNWLPSAGRRSACHSESEVARRFTLAQKTLDDVGKGGDVVHPLPPP